MKFFKEHSGLIIKLFVNQFGLTFVGLILAAATSKIAWLLLFSSIFATVFYLALIYNAMWEQGAKDGIRVNAGRAERIPHFPLRVALWASVPNFFGAFLLLVCYLLGPVAGISFCTDMFAVEQIVIPLFQGMYTGIFSAILGQIGNTLLKYAVVVLLYIFSSAPMIGVAVLSYRMGEKNVRLFPAKKKEQ